MVTRHFRVIESQAKYVFAIFCVKITPKSENISHAKFLFIKFPVLVPIFVIETLEILPVSMGENTSKALREKSITSGYLLQLGLSLAVTTTPVFPY